MSLPDDDAQAKLRLGRRKQLQKILVAVRINNFNLPSESGLKMEYQPMMQ